MSGPDDIEAYLEDLLESTYEARREELDARASGDRDAELRARMKYHRLRETFQDEVQASTNRMMRDYIESEMLKRWRRDQRKLRKGGGNASDG